MKRSCAVTGDTLFFALFFYSSLFPVLPLFFLFHLLQSFDQARQTPLPSPELRGLLCRPATRFYAGSKLGKILIDQFSVWSESETTPCSTLFSSIASNGTPNFDRKNLSIVMGNDSRILETKSVGIVDEDREENELMLKLSIGGILRNRRKRFRM